LGEEEEMRTHYIIVEHGALIEYEKIYFDIIFSLLDFNSETTSK